MEFFFLLFICFAVFAIFAAIHGHRKEKERRAALATWAGQNRLYYHPDKVRGFDDEHRNFGFLRSGSNRYAYNIITGNHRDRALTAFDYHYETHSTDSKGHRTTHHHHFSCLFLTPGFPLKPIAIRRETFFDKIKSTFGFQDINFESSEFSRKFHVSGEDKRWCYDVIHNRMMEFLLGAPEYSLESDYEKLSVRPKGRFELPELEQLLAFTHQFLDNIPTHLTQNTAN
jgi:hypothetical protein